MSDVAGDHIFGGDADMDGFVNEGVCQFFDFLVDSSGEKESLAVAREPFDELSDVVDKSEVEHVVGFVEYK